MEVDKERLEELFESCPVLTPYDRELVRLRDIEGMRNKDVADEFGKAPSMHACMHEIAETHDPRLVDAVFKVWRKWRRDEYVKIKN